MFSVSYFLCRGLIIIGLHRTFCHGEQIKLTDISDISQAIAYVIQNSFQSKVVYISTIANDKENYDDQSDILSEVLISINNSARVINYCSELEKNALRFYNIFIIDSYEAFQLLYNQLKNQSYDLSGYYLIALTQTPSDYKETMTRIFRDSWNIFIANVNILVEPTAKKIQMYSYFPFTSSHCSDVSPVLINYFINGAMINNRFLYPVKMHNLHRCPLMLVMWPNQPYIFINRHDRHLDGIEGLIVENMAQRLNFTVKLIELPGVNPRGKIFENGSMTGSFATIKSGKGNFSVGNFRYTVQRAYHLAATQPYYQVPIVLAVRQGVMYSSLERLRYPFGPIIWIAIISSLAIGLLLILILQQFARPQVESFVIGSNNTAPVYNMFVGAIGGQVNPMPRRNFARFILMIWFLGTLVLRGAYQGSLYKFIRTDAKKYPPNTIRAIIDDHYIIRTSDTAAELIKNFKELNDLHEFTAKSIDDNLYDIQHSEQRIAVLCPRDFVTHFNNVNYHDGVLHIVRERLFIQQVCMIFQKYSYLTASVNQLLNQFSSGGLINKWGTNFIEQKYSQFYARLKQPNQFRNHHLAGAYQIYFMFLGVACFVFLLEILTQYIMVLKRVFK